ncbi:MAG: glutamyl-tRNA reductase [Eubacteriales bacterium]|nr:glutamyl-tRNA reductase [Eubacteriales bacterium]
MSIQMTGIDHTKASVDVRTIFSFTKKNIADAFEAWKDIPGLCGCVIISTCNRMEVWASVQEDEEPDLFELLCREKNVDVAQYRRYAVNRRDKEAVEHLFELSCGLKSRILGEDQIITQVKDALAFAREHYAADNVLEVLFRMAVTAAKKVKTEILLRDRDSSVIHRAAEVLKEQGYVLRDKKCMVIGNGEMGKLSAGLLLLEGAEVTVTVRQYRSGIVDIPAGCQRIDYGRRMEIFPSCDYVVSATASPNYTLKKADILELDLKKPVVLIDLAVPRDIEPCVEDIEGITRFDIDDFDAGHLSEQTLQDIARAKEILREQMREFYDWYEGRDVIAKVQQVRAAAVEDFHLRTQKQVRELEKLSMMPPEESRAQLQTFQEYMEAAAGKVINKMMFGLRGKVSERTFCECVEALGELYGQKDTYRKQGKQAGGDSVGDGKAGN